MKIKPYINKLNGSKEFKSFMKQNSKAFMIAGFSFQGTELIGIAAGESKNPSKDVPKAVKQVFWRILLFFIISIIIISFLIPYTSAQLIENNIISEVINLCGIDMWQIHNELVKLYTYKKSGNIIKSQRQ